jgi:hypothetical protein
VLHERPEALSPVDRTHGGPAVSAPTEFVTTHVHRTNGTQAMALFEGADFVVYVYRYGSDDLHPSWKDRDMFFRIYEPVRP